MTSWSELHYGIIAHLQTRRLHQRGDSGHGASLGRSLCDANTPLGAARYDPLLARMIILTALVEGAWSCVWNLPFGKELFMARTTSAKTSTTDKKKASGTAKSGGTPKAAAGRPRRRRHGRGRHGG